jgi:hypothetical protein
MLYWSYQSRLIRYPRDTPIIMPPQKLTHAEAACRPRRLHRHIYTLASLALLLPTTQQAEVLAEAGAELIALLQAYRSAADNSMIHSYYLCNTAIELAPLLPPACLTELSTFAQAIDHQRMRAYLLDGLAMRMPGLLDEARAAADVMPNDTLRIDLLAKLAAYLPAEQQTGAYAAILSSAREIDDGATVAAAVVALTEQLPTALQPQALAVARGLPSAGARTYALMGLAATMPTSEQAALYAEATESLFAISNANKRADAIAEFAAYLPAERLPAALDAVRAADKRHCGELLVALIPQLPVEQRPVVCEEAIALAHHRQGYNDIWLLMEIAPHLPHDRRLDAYREVIQMACDDTDMQSLDDLLPELIAQLPGELLEEAFAAFDTLPQAAERAYRLVRMAPHISAERIWDRLRSEPALMIDIERLIPWLPDTYLPELIASLGSIESLWSRAELVAVLAPRLAADQQASIYADMLEAVSVSPWNRSEAIVQLAPGLPSDLLERAYELADSIDTPAERAQALAAVLPRLPAERAAILAAEVLTSLPADSDHYGYILRNMVPNLPDQLLVQALVLSCHLPNIWWPEVAALVAPRLASYARDHRSDVLPYVYTALRALAAQGRERLLRDLAALAPVLAALAPPQALGEVVTTIGDVARRWP